MRSLALKTKKKSTDEESLTCGSEDEEYAMTLSRNKNQSAFVGGSWNDNDQEEQEKTKHETCLMAQESNERKIGSRILFIEASTDDLFLFARGHPNSIRVIIDALEEFKNVSGLVPSIPQRNAFFCNVLNTLKASILSSMPFAKAYEGFLMVPKGDEESAFTSMSSVPPRLVDVLAFLIPSKGPSVSNVISQIVLAAMTYCLWNEWNSILFKKEVDCRSDCLTYYFFGADEACYFQVQEDDYRVSFAA
uniref:Uncharacterized protein n=1 Tax=Tanacetum cinerariifolium TaxID=118510 RepID=A0A6L2MCF5_TANCI|nr:hypothetical protein [Tanacetum cinerariifolium]